MRRIIFVNLHGNEFLVKTINKIIFKQSVAVKHRYLLNYLLDREDIEVCTFLNDKSMSISYTHAEKFPKWMVKLEHRYIMKKNGIPLDKVTVLTDEAQIRKDDIIVIYNYYANQYEFKQRPNCLIAVSHIHFNTSNAEKMRAIDPDVLYNEANFQHGSKIYDEFYSWFKKDFYVIPFIYADRFVSKKYFKERKDKCFSTGTVTYMHNITPYYGDPCAQPTRKQIMTHREELKDYVDCYNSDYLEDTEDKKLKGKTILARFYNAVYSKLFSGRQKKYYSFDMVEKFNDYKMCLIGEEVMQIPGIGFVEGMACGCAYIGQMVGYYEDYGMQEGVHYIGYDGTIEDLKKKIAYYQMPEHQEELESIAKTGCDFVRKNFCGSVIAEGLVNKLLNKSGLHK
ncbi:MAG: glycosyltransferase family 1 protein [Bacteroidaceae bacterium]|nr:glycosyltransferase family 1 protein [Bacteroidaceae bacterium]